MNRYKRASAEQSASSELAQRRVMAVLACLKELCPSADSSAQQLLANQILMLVDGNDLAVPQRLITPAALYEMFTRNSQCVLNRTGRCPLLVFTKQFCEELNEFLKED